MSDRWKSGEPISASKLNRNSASTGPSAFYGSNSFQKSGNAFGSVSNDLMPESFWVAIEDEPEQVVLNQAFASNRTVYKHSWTEVTFDPVRGAWRRNPANKGSAKVDPVYNVDPTQQISVTGAGSTIGSSTEKFVTQVYPVTRDPHSGILFFFS